MKVKEAIKILKKIEKQGFGDTKLLVDVEARTFNYHMISIDNISLNLTEKMTGENFVGVYLKV